MRVVGPVSLLCSLLCVALLGGCSSIEVVRLQPGLLRTPPKTEPLAAIQVRCVGFYAFTIGVPTCDLERVINELLLKRARELGAKQLLGLRFRQTPEGGIWWLTKLLWFRTASAWAIAVVGEPTGGSASGGLDLATAGEPKPRARSGPASGPAWGPASRPASPSSSRPASRPASPSSSRPVVGPASRLAGPAGPGGRR